MPKDPAESSNFPPSLEALPVVALLLELADANETVKERLRRLQWPIAPTSWRKLPEDIGGLATVDPVVALSS